MKHHLVLSASKGAVLYLRVFMFGLDVYIKYLCPCCTFFLLGEAGAEETRAKISFCSFQKNRVPFSDEKFMPSFVLTGVSLTPVLPHAQGNLYKEIWLALEKHKREELAVGRGF